MILRWNSAAIAEEKRIYELAQAQTEVVFDAEVDYLHELVKTLGEREASHEIQFDEPQLLWSISDARFGSLGIWYLDGKLMETSGDCARIEYDAEAAKEYDVVRTQREFNSSHIGRNQRMIQQLENLIGLDHVVDR